MMIMKNIVKRVLSFMMVLMLVVMAVPVSEVKAYNSDAGEITITNVTNENQFVGYKIMDITYDAQKNNVSYEWTDEAKEAIKQANNGLELTVEKFFEKQGDSYKYNEEARQRLLSGIPASLNKEPELELKTASNNQVEWDDVELGGYLIKPTLTTDVYQMMLVFVQPEYDAGGDIYTTKDGTIDAKKTPLNITKTVEKDTTGALQTGKYTIEVDRPTYESGTIDDTFIVGDKLDQGLSLVSESIKIYGYDPNADGDKYVLLGSQTPSTVGTYTVTENGDIDATYKAQTFYVDFDYTKISQYTKIKIEYDVTLDASEKQGTYNNTAVVKYSNYPFVNGSFAYDTSVKSVDTYKLRIDKINASSEKLAGAEFSLYQKISDTTGLTDEQIMTELEELGIYTSQDTYTGGTGNDVPQLDVGTYICVKVFSGDDFDGDDNVEKDGDDKGYYSIDKLAAGEYFIVETKAPTGYTLPDKSYHVTVNETKDEEDLTDDNIVLMQITNLSGFTLPETGGTGTVIFTVVGVSLMCVAVLAFFILRKKEMNKN